MTRTLRYFCCAVAMIVATAPGLPTRVQAQGISPDEYFQLFPHFPVQVKAEVQDGAVVISWQKPPPAPDGQVGYDRNVASYKIYRLDRKERRALIGRTTGTTFIDRTPLKPGTVRRYGVSAMQGDGRESDVSPVAEVRVPGQ